MKTGIQFFVRILLGGAFLFSAFAKLYPIESFELLLLRQGIASWEVAPFFSRLLIASEAFLGMLIILGMYQKLVLRTTMTVLVLFTLYIVFILVKEGQEADCGCMGDFVKLNPYESILKNIALLGLAFYLLRFQSYSFTFYPGLAVIFLAITFFPLPFILNPPDSYFIQQGHGKDAPVQLDMNLLQGVTIDGQKTDLSQGKYVLAFLSINCPHCRLAASKLQLIREEVKELPPVYAIFAGNEEEIPGFFKETKSQLPYYYMADRQSFIKLTRGSFPVIVYLKDGKVEKQFSSFELDPETFQKAIIQQ